MESLIGVGISILIYLGLGTLWYHPQLLGQIWPKSPETGQPPTKFYKQYLTLGLVSAVIIGVLLNAGLINNHYTLEQRVYSVLILWFGFVFVPSAINTLQSSRGYKLLAVDTGFILVSLLAISLTFHILLDLRPKGTKIIVDPESRIIDDTVINLRKKVVFEATVFSGTKAGRDYCLDGLYVSYMGKTLLLRDNSGMIKDKSYLNKQVTLEGIYPAQDNFCKALICDCDDYVLVERITLN